LIDGGPRSLDDLIPPHWREKPYEGEVLSIIGAPPQGQKKPRRKAPEGQDNTG
jgi:hypothetical protein